MKKPGRGRKKNLSSRKHKRAKKRAHQQRQQDQRELRLLKIEGGWKPPTQEEKDEQIAERQVRAQDRVTAAEKRKAERKAKAAADMEKQKTIAARLKDWMAKKAEERKERAIAAAQDKQKRRAARAAQRQEAQKLGH